jgi:CHASE1-domain containing sensor protein
LPSVLAALVGGLLTIVVWHDFRARETQLAELEFKTRSDDYHAILQNGINDYLDRIQAVQALFSSVEHVSRQQFLDYVNILMAGYPAIIAVSWVPRVTHDQREAHERAGIGEGYLDYRIKCVDRHQHG